MDAWSTHNWLNPDGRSLNLNGHPKKEYFCIKCKRHFVELAGSGERFAAFPSALDFDPLAEEISEQWLSEPCPGAEQASDLAAYKNRPRLTKRSI